MTLTKEIEHVARLIIREAGKGDSALVLATIRQLRPLAMRLHRAYETACNREQTKAELEAEAADETRVRALCERLGVKVRFNGDPRGAPVQIPCSPGNSNSFGGDTILIPWLHAREYK